MRFKIKQKTIKKDPKVGDIRIKKAFLLFPKKLQNERRWLEYAAWEQRCYLRTLLHTGSSYATCAKVPAWTSYDMKWRDDKLSKQKKIKAILK